MWSASIDGISEHARGELGNFGDLMARPVGFVMAFRAWQYVEHLRQMPRESGRWPSSEIDFHYERKHKIMLMRDAVCSIMAVVVQKAVPLGERDAFEAELERQYGKLDAGDRVPEEMARALFQQVFMAHSQSVAQYVRGAGFGRNWWGGWRRAAAHWGVL